MAEASRGSKQAGADDVAYSQAYKAHSEPPNKRRSVEQGDGEPSPKYSKTGTGSTSVKPIKMSLSTSSVTKEVSDVPKKKQTVASVFNNDSDSSEDEMPPEAKMRMRNIGRNTPTAAGPNSFGKGRLGFCDRQKMIQRDIEKDGDKE